MQISFFSFDLAQEQESAIRLVTPSTRAKAVIHDYLLHF